MSLFKWFIPELASLLKKYGGLKSSSCENDTMEVNYQYHR